MKVLIFCLAIMCASCGDLNPDVYYARFFDAATNKNELSADSSAIDACLAVNSKVSRARCDPQTCFSNPFTMKGNQWLLEDIAPILSELNIPYWLDSGTLIGQLRFGAVMPWDDDIDIATMPADFLPKLEEFRKKTAALGYDLRVQHSLPGLDKISAVLVVFSAAKYREMALKVAHLYNFPITLQEIHELWLEYNYGEPFPRLDMEMLQRNSSDGTITFVNPLFQHQVVNESDVFPLTTGCMMGKKYSIPNQVANYLSSQYGAPNIEFDWVMSSEHNPKCMASIRLKDAREFPGWLSVTNAYLKTIYGDNLKSTCS